MDDQPVIRILHHMARTGGTVISRCLAVMDSVVLLSEIHPLGTAYFHPLKQAWKWFQLVTEEEVGDPHPLDEREFVEAISLVRRRAQLRGQRLVLRDWSHLDFTGEICDVPGFVAELETTYRRLWAACCRTPRR